ncbi:MAG: MBL fold metallo-hydrolase, partial [candidate division WOR-3 bacterium]
MCISNTIQHIKWLGHASFFIEEKGCNIYIDPWKIKSNLPKADIILISHEHFDHCSTNDVGKLLKQDTLIICNLASSKNFTDKNIKVVHPKEEVNFKNTKIQTVVAYNINKSFHPKSNEGLGFIVETSIGKIYHCGYTDFIPEMKDIKCDIAL